jgi:hypothetical protein
MTLPQEVIRLASEARTALFRGRAVEKLPMINRIDPEGAMSLRKIAQKLNDMNVPTVSGKGSWSANSVRRLKAAS